MVVCVHVELRIYFVCFPREEESLVDMFVIEILVVLIHSLKMAHRDEKSLGKYSHEWLW